MTSGTSAILVEKVVDWLRRQALEDTELDAVIRGCCERLSAAGVPLARANMSFAVLHPLYRAVGFTWRRKTGLIIEGMRHVPEGEVDRFAKSPYFHMLANDLDHLRRRLDHAGSNDFPIFDDLRAEGITDYLAFRAAFSKGNGRGLIGSWSTDNKEGFSEENIVALLRIQDRLAMTAKLAVQTRLTSSMLSTYLGKDAGERVLHGQVKRGDGETIKAAIVVADMRRSTQLAEQLGRQAYIDTLNAFFDNVASAFVDAGGEILSFLGDGFLAIFPTGDARGDRTAACRAAHIAALNAVERMNEQNAERTRNDQVPIGFGIGLHIGKVMFGNVGLPDRLAFSVFGSGVNEATRLESITKIRNTPIIASEEFRVRCEGEWEALGNETLRGVGREFAIYRPVQCGPSCDKQRIDRRVHESGMSDAEAVVLLYQDQRA